MSLVPWYSRVVGTRRSTNRIRALPSGSASSDPLRHTEIAVHIRNAPKTKKVAAKRSIAAAPSTIRMPRRIRAITMPIDSTRCRCCSGTANDEMMIMKTNRLSTLSEYSVMYPARNSPPYWRPKVTVTKPANSMAMTT